MVVKTKDQEPAKVAGPERMMTHDGSEAYRHYRTWLASLKDPLLKVRDVFNEAYAEVLGEDAPFNKERLEALYFNQFDKELDPAIERYTSGKDKVMKKYYEEYFKEKWDLVDQAMDLFLEKYNNKQYSRGQYGEGTLPSSAAQIKCLDFEDGVLVIDPSKIQIRKSDFDVYTEDQGFIEATKLCDELAEAYNRLLLNLKERDTKVGRNMYKNHVPAITFFLRTKQNSTELEALYDNIN